MTRRELAAAGITDPGLCTAYAFCRRLNARHGRTYFLATRFLPVERRPAVHALYGFARWADDIVDDLGSGAGPGERADALRGLEEELHGGLCDGVRTGGGSREPVVRALAHTAAEYAIEHRHFTDFLASMRMDLEVREYRSWADLACYTHGSAAVIGLQMVPVLGTVVPRAEAEPHAAALGVAFQLTNFLRDVGEDLDRGRIYLPLDLLASHGVDRGLLEWSRRTGGTDRRIRAALVEAADHTRGVYREAEPGIEMLDPVSRPCIRAAFTLYGEILDAVAAGDYPVLRRRVAVSGRRRAVVALGALGRVLLLAGRGRHGRSGRARDDAPCTRGDAYAAVGNGLSAGPAPYGSATGAPGTAPGTAPDAAGPPTGAARAARRKESR